MTSTSAPSTIAIRTPRRAPRSRFVRAVRDPRTIVGLVCLVIVLFVTFAGPFLAPYGVDQFVAPPFQPPSAQFPLGTDVMGQDVLSRVLYGGWTVVWMSVLAATIGMVLGVFFGALAGYRRGWLDETIMRLSDVAMALPTIVFVLLFVSMLGRNLFLIVLLVGLAHVPQVARVVRGVTVDVSEREFVESAQALGASPLRAIATQIIPNITGTIMVEYGLRVVWSIVAIAALSVLGQGVQAPTADWGLMINENRTALSFQPWSVVAPLIMIALFALAANLIAEGIGRALHVGSTEGRA